MLIVTDQDKTPEGEACVPGNINGIDGDTTTDLSSSSTDVATASVSASAVVSVVSDDATMVTPPSTLTHSLESTPLKLLLNINCYTFANILHPSL